MKRGQKETQINMNKFLKVKKLVDSKSLKVKEACKVLDISPYVYTKWSKKVDEMNGVEKV